MFKSVNKIIVEPYKVSEGIKTQVRNGIAFTEQKSGVVGLQMLAGVTLSDGTFIPAKSVAYFLEDTLMQHPWVKQIRTCPDIEKPFIVCPSLDHVQFFGIKND